MLPSNRIDKKDLFPPQKEVLDLGFLTSKDHWIISLPTGAGKTLLGEFALLQAIQKGYKGAYLSPLKAIVEEKKQDWMQQYPEVRWGLFTGDSKRKGKNLDKNPQNCDVLLCTPERFDAYLRGWRTHISWIAKLDVLIVDEFHLLCQENRGARLEALITRALRLNPFLRIIGLSATLANLSELAGWLNARTYESNWRLVPIKKRIHRFKRLKDKPDLLKVEITETLKKNGKTLVFTNSRRRAENLASILRRSGFETEYHHAGLPREKRLNVEDKFRKGKLDVLVATSTLEMGINLPARKVIIYDGYAFNGQQGFSQLSVLSYLQRSGRAGRPGLDATGESVMFIPAWAGSTRSYENEDLEPVRSALFNHNLLAEQILADISSKIAITKDQLEQCFADRTLWRYQGGNQQLDTPLELLTNAGMVTEKTKDNVTYLNATAIGRLGVQLFLSPMTILLIKNIYDNASNLTFFDLLLFTTITNECGPRLWFHFEEIDYLGDLILSVPSTLLDGTLKNLEAIIGKTDERHLLASIKMAALLYSRIQGKCDDELTESFSCYPSDLRLLFDNSVWIIGGIGALFSALHRKMFDEEVDYQNHIAQQKRYAPLPEDLCNQLAIMIKYGISKEAISLVSIPGVGGERAKTLLRSGYENAEDVALAEHQELASLPGFGLKSASKIIDEVSKTIKTESTYYEEEPVKREKKQFNWPQAIDPYRLRRALELKIKIPGKEKVVVTGGSEPRFVKINIKGFQREFQCNCPDFERRKLPCKHILRVQMEYSEGLQLKEYIRQLSTIKEISLRYNLGNMWFNSVGIGKKNNGNETETTGKFYLQQPIKKRR
jgi:helicase